MIHQGSREPQLVRILALVRCKSSKSGQDCRSWRSLFLPVLELFFQDFAIFCACGCGMLWHFILIWQRLAFGLCSAPWHPLLAERLPLTGTNFLQRACGFQQKSDQSVAVEIH